MVSFATLATAVAATIALSSLSTTLANPEPMALAAGTYYRPFGSLVSGIPGATTPFRRSPCPAINTLANHGYLPRSGQNITRQGLFDAVVTHFNLDAGLATFVTSLVPVTFNLDLLGTHGFIEHDASLVRRDAFFGRDPAFADGQLLEDFLSRASRNAPFTIQTLGEVRRDRIAECHAINPNCTFDGQASFLAFGEATFVVSRFGNGDGSNTASLANVRSFLVNEKFPVGYKRPTQELTMEGLTATSALIQAVANANA